VLRITQSVQSPDVVALIVEGEIRRPWVSELESEFAACRSSGRRVVMNFAGVKFVSAEGVDAVKRLIDHGAQLVEVPGMIEELFR
jgi:hypothetical protein